MFAKFNFWVKVNVYALLLDVLALLTFWGAYLLFQTGIVFGLIATTVGVFLLYGAIGIHGTYLEKRRIYSLLLRRNSRLFRVESFKDFMSVPCHRVLVRMVLVKLGRESEYPIIKKRYYCYPWQSRFRNDTILRVFTSQ